MWPVGEVNRGTRHTWPLQSWTPANLCKCSCVFQPERIDPSASRQGYDVRSDVWSLGITLVRSSRSASATKSSFPPPPLWAMGQTKIDKSSSVVLVSSTSWPRGSFPTPSGTVFSISWRKWWKANLRSSATLRTGSSRPCSSTLLTYGKRHSCPACAVAALVGCSGKNCNWNQVRFFFLANGTIVVSLFVSSLTKDESKRPKYRELLVSTWTSIHTFMNELFVSNDGAFHARAIWESVMFGCCFFLLLFWL